MSETHSPVLVRMTNDLKQELQRQAAINGRTLTGEINDRLRQTLGMLDATSDKKKPAKPTGEGGLKVGEHVNEWGGVSHTETERVLLALYKRLSPEKQLAVLSLLK